jgi:hypothetical protein
MDTDEDGFKDNLIACCKKCKLFLRQYEICQIFHTFLDKKEVPIQHVVCQAEKNSPGIKNAFYRVTAQGKIIGLRPIKSHKEP